MVGKPSDVRVTAAELYLLPVPMRVPLKFGAETLTSITCARVRVEVVCRDGRRGEGWGETPLSVGWVWPGSLPFARREEALKDFCRCVGAAWAGSVEDGHPMELGDQFRRTTLARLLDEFNAAAPSGERMPLLAGLVCCSAFDIALHDAYGQALATPTYETYGPEHMNRDLSTFLEPAAGAGIDFRGLYPRDFFHRPAAKMLPAWHLVGGLDPLDADDLTGGEPDDGHPVLLADWIRRDGLRCLKVKLRGNDAAWDYERLVRVGRIAAPLGVTHLTADFNCLVTDPSYVNAILDRLRAEQGELHAMLLYVEQPFPYDLEANRIDVHSVAGRKPLLMDESAHDWELVRLGRSLGWNGVALKTCKTQTGALLSLCWAKAHGMHLMVQDLTNPMLAQIPHLLLAAHAGTMLGVESNAMQFYPAASDAEAEVHPGLYRRVNGELDLSSIRGPGFGYRVGEILRPLPLAEARWG